MIEDLLFLRTKRSLIYICFYFFSKKEVFISLFYFWFNDFLSISTDVHFKKLTSFSTFRSLFLTFRINQKTSWNVSNQRFSKSHQNRELLKMFFSKFSCFCYHLIFSLYFINSVSVGYFHSVFSMFFFSIFGVYSLFLWLFRLVIF